MVRGQARRDYLFCTSFWRNFAAQGLLHDRNVSIHFAGVPSHLGSRLIAAWKVPTEVLRLQPKEN
jgi:hypothetical protein